MNGLLTDLYELTMAAGYFEAGKTDEKATFELAVRRLPANRNYVLAAGLPQVVDYLLNLSFTAEEVDYLRGLPQFRAGPSGIFRLSAGVPFHGRPVRRSRGHAAVCGRAGADHPRAHRRSADSGDLRAVRGRVSHR